MLAEREREILGFDAVLVDHVRVDLRAVDLEAHEVTETAGQIALLP